MYKVFIDNKPIIFQINSQSQGSFDKDRVWNRINHYLESNELVLKLELSDDKDFQSIFSDYKKVSAAGGLVQKDDAFLFIKRNGFWDIPKGKLEKGESIEDGAIREVEEECGIKGPIIIRHLIDTYHTYPHKGKKVLKTTHWFLMAEGKGDYDLIPQTEEGISEVRFIKENEFDIVRSQTYNSIIDVIDCLE